MVKKYIFSILVLLLCALQSQAVLKEDSISSSLSVLRSELEQYHNEYGEKQKLSNRSAQLVFKELIEAVQETNKNALMLYSQKDGYVFDLAYACHEAIAEYNNFEKHLVPFRSFVDKNNNELGRLDSLINLLKTMPVINLSEKAKTDRNVCLALAVNTRRMVMENRDQLNEYIFYYEGTERRLKNLNDYANKKYEEIQRNIFKNGDDNYVSIILKLRHYLSETKDNVLAKYSTPSGVRSQWSSRLVFGIFFIIFCYALVAIALNQVLVRWLATRLIRKKVLAGSWADWFMEKRTVIVMASTCVTFAILVGIVKATMSDQNFLQMAANLLIQYAWLLSVVIISLLLRTKTQLTLRTFFVYLPLLVNGFIVITFRIILIPNTLVNVIFPPILLACCLWQWYVLHKHKMAIDRYDRTYAYISQFFFVCSLVCSLTGFTLFSVQILIWWIMQLTGVLTITCMKDWIRGYSIQKHIDEMPVTKTWFYDFIYKVGLPVCGVLSVVISLYWAADVFNLSSMTAQLFSAKFINTANFSASIFDVALVVTLWFVFNYINRTAKAFVKLFYEQHDPSNAAQKFMMVKNVMQVLIWGIWFIVSMNIFKVSNTWLVVIGGGLSTGIGFASKDILENIYYGLSLMMGRIKIGDLIICDGVRGTVSSISYTSTMIDTVDGSVIAFQNSQLFTKNYKNMTRNHGYEMHSLDVGVAYGTNVKEVKQIIKEAVSRLDCINKKKGVSVVLRELGDSALLLKVVVWVNVFTQFGDDGQILEAIYDAFNEHNIEIPFPQTDVHMR